MESKKKKIVREALGDSDDEGVAGQGKEAALPNLSDSEDEGKKEVKHQKSLKRNIIFTCNFVKYFDQY